MLRDNTIILHREKSVKTGNGAIYKCEAWNSKINRQTTLRQKQLKPRTERQNAGQKENGGHVDQTGADNLRVSPKRCWKNSAGVARSSIA